MKILFDQGTPVPLRRFLTNHQVSTAFEQGWSNLQNGDLLRAADAAGFECFVTTDQQLKYQQNLGGRKLAIVVILSTSWPKMQSSASAIVFAIDQVALGSYVEVPV